MYIVMAQTTLEKSKNTTKIKGRERVRTKNTLEKTKKMQSLAEDLGWKLTNNANEDMQRSLVEAGVR